MKKIAIDYMNFVRMPYCRGLGISLFLTKFIVLLIIFLVTNRCDSDIVGDKIYTVTGETVGQYIANRPESYSEFSRLLEKSGTMGLLQTYGDYTCFLPDNQAMIDFYQSKGKTSLDDFQTDSLKAIAFDHIIKGFVVTSGEFVDGFLSNLTMSGRYLRVSTNVQGNSIIYRINTTSTITIKDIKVHNGVIHTINKTLSPTQSTLFESILEDEKFSLFREALIETGLFERLMLIRDESYSPGDLLEKDGILAESGSMGRVPRERKYGFTAFIESDETYAENSIQSLDDMKAYAAEIYDNIYPEDAGITDFSDPKNSYNRFVAYHLVNKKLTNKLLIEKYDNTGRNFQSKGETHSIKTTDMCEYIEPMCSNTLIEIRTLRSSGEYNIINMNEETGEAIRLTDDFDNDAMNGVYHEIDGILTYSTEIDRMLSSKRLRMDAASFFPELTNNNMRIGHASPDYSSERWYFPQDYFDRVKCSETTTFGYFNSDDRYCDYQGDEVFLTGLYDFEIVTPPVPAGTYEVRFGYVPNSSRGVAQLYWDGIPTGIPLDLRLLANDPKIGYETPGSNPDDPLGYENDKMMRNRGYMKAPACFGVIDPAWFNGGPARNETGVLRRILGIYTFTEAKNHKFKVTAVKSGQFMFDYLEFVPLEVLEYEDIY